MNLVLDSEPLRLLLDGLTSPAPLRGSDRLRWNTLRQLAAEVARTGGAVVAPELALLELSRRPAAVAQLQAGLRTVPSSAALCRRGLSKVVSSCEPGVHLEQKSRPKAAPKCALTWAYMVGTCGLEPQTPTVSRRITGLR